jgi:hypothetical protein
MMATISWWCDFSARRCDGPLRANPHRVHAVQTHAAAVIIKSVNEVSPALIVVGICLALAVIVAFGVQTARRARHDRERWRSADDRPQLMGAPMGEELANGKLDARLPRRYLDTEYWLAAGGDILAIDVLSLTRPEFQPKADSD